MRRLAAAAAAAILTLTACVEPIGGPADPPTHEETGRWQEWLDEQPGITTLDEEPRLPWHSGPQAVVRADDAQAVESLVEALEQEPDEGLAVAIVVDIDGARSELRHLPHLTPAESVEALLAPMPEGVRLRAIGYPAERWWIDDGPLPKEAVLDIRYFADDILPAALELTAPDDHSVSVTDGDFGETGDDVRQLGGNVDEQHWRTMWPEFRELAEAFDVAMGLEQPPADVSHDVIRFRQRAAAVAAAQQLEDTPFTISTVRGDHSFYLYPERGWRPSSPSRDELIVFAHEHEDAHIGTIDGIEVEYADPAACDGFLDDLPAWSGTITLDCATPSGGFIRARSEVAELPQLFDDLQPVVGDSGGGIRWYPDAVQGSLWEGGDLDAQIRAFRELGWTGEVDLTLIGAPRDGDERWGAKVDFRSTPTGKATGVQGSRAGQRGELVEAWDATATS